MRKERKALSVISFSMTHMTYIMTYIMLLRIVLERGQKMANGYEIKLQALINKI